MRTYDILTLDEIAKQEHGENNQIIRDLIQVLNTKKSQYIRLSDNWDLRWKNGDLVSEKLSTGVDFDLFLANALLRGIPVVLLLSNLKVATTLMTNFDSCTVMVQVNAPYYTLSFNYWAGDHVFTHNINLDK